MGQIERFTSGILRKGFGVIFKGFLGMRRPRVIETNQFTAQLFRNVINLSRKIFYYFCVQQNSANHATYQVHLTFSRYDQRAIRISNTKLHFIFRLVLIQRYGNVSTHPTRPLRNHMTGAIGTQNGDPLMRFRRRQNVFDHLRQIQTPKTHPSSANINIITHLLAHAR